MKLVYLLLCGVCIGGKISFTEIEKIDVTITGLQVNNGQAEGGVKKDEAFHNVETTADELNGEMFFVDEPAKEYYLVKNKPVTIKCSVFNARFINVKCVGQWLNPQIIIESANKNSEKSFKTAKADSEIDSGAGNEFQNDKNKNFFSKVIIKVNKNDLKDFVDPQGYWCECYAWRHPDLSIHHAIRSSRAIVHLAYMRRYFEREPLSTSVEVGGTVQLECLPPPGTPLPEVSWMKGSRVIDARNDANFIVSNEGNLIIVQARLSDADNYTCVAQNVAFKLLSDQARVVVYEKVEWSAWSDCSNKCSQGRSKKCNQRVPVQAGMYCVQDWQEWRLCGAHGEGEEVKKGAGSAGGETDGERQDNANKKEVFLCPISQWSEWSAWSSCSVDCIQHKRRYCNSANDNDHKKEDNNDEINNINNNYKGNNNNNNERDEKEADQTPDVTKHEKSMIMKNKNEESKLKINKNKVINSKDGVHESGNDAINNHTNYCSDHELEMRKCASGGCLLDEWHQSEVTKATIIVILIIIISTVVIIVLFITACSLRCFPSKSMKFGKSKCMEIGMGVQAPKTAPMAPATAMKENITSSDVAADHSKDVHCSHFRICCDTSLQKTNCFENDQLISKPACNVNPCLPRNQILFGSYRKKFKMLKKLTKQMRTEQGDKELLENMQNCSNNWNLCDKEKASAIKNHKNFLRVENTNTNNDSNSSNNDSSNSLHNKKACSFATSPSTSSSTTTPYKHFKRHERLNEDVKEMSCDDVTKWGIIGTEGGEIKLENLDVSISFPKSACSQESCIFLSISRRHRPQLKGTQTLLSSVVLCGFESEESALLRPATIKLRHNAMSVNSSHWLFTLFKFNQSACIETSHLPSASFTLDDEFCYVTDHVLSGYALIGQLSSVEGSGVDSECVNSGSSLMKEVTNNYIYNNDKSCKRSNKYRKNYSNNTSNSTSPTINFENVQKKGSKNKIFSSEKSIDSEEDCNVNSGVGENENNYDVVVYAEKPENTHNDTSYSRCNDKMNDQFRSPDENIYTNLSTELLTNNEISKRLKLLAFFLFSADSYKFHLRIYLIDDNADSFEYAVEMEKRQGYTLLGTPQTFQLQFQRGAGVQVSLTSLHPAWTSLNLLQEIPFGHLWNNHQIDIHCSFSLHYQHHLQQQHQTQLLQQQQQTHQHPYYQQLSFHEIDKAQDLSVQNEDITSYAQQQTTVTDAPADHLDFSCIVLVKQKDFQQNATKYPLIRRCSTHNLDDFHLVKGIRIRDAAIEDRSLHNEDSTGVGEDCAHKSYLGLNYAPSQGGRQNLFDENVYNSVYDKASGSETSVYKPSIADDSHSNLMKLLTKQLDKQGWKELAVLMGLQSYIGYFEGKKYPAELLLSLWHIKSHSSEPLTELLQHFKTMQRPDLIETIELNLPKSS